MEKKQANSKAVKLFNQWRKEFCDNSEPATDEYFKKLNAFKKECEDLHNVPDVYYTLTDKNALKMASICSSLKFVQPYRMLMQLQKKTGSY